MMRGARQGSEWAHPPEQLHPFPLLGEVISEHHMNSTTKTLIKLLAVLLISGSMFLVPFDALGAPLNDIQVRVIALFVMAALMWILEPIPIWTTSTLVITLALLGISSQSLTCLRPDRYNATAITAVVAEACAGTVAPEALESVQQDVAATLKKQKSLSADSVRAALATSFMNTGKAAAKAGDSALQTALATASGKLYSADITARLEDMAFVNVAQQRSIMATFADPIIILFLGGFFLAAAATKYRLDINLARVLLKPFGTNPKFVLLGLMVVTGLFSMFMSNTATAAMMLAILSPVLALFKPEDKGRAAFALAIPIAANVGGIGTPIGTPPNAIALKAMQDYGLDISFGKWMMFGTPFVIIMMLIGWLILLKMFPIDQKELRLTMGGKFLKTPKAIIVYITFAVTVALWVMGSGVHGLDSNTIAIIPVAVFAITGVITKKDLNAMSWDVLWLVAGGFALGLALQDTGLAKDLISAIPFHTWNPMMLMVGSGFICLFMATFMSHTATASLLLPILAAVAGTMMGAGAMDNAGAIGLLIAIALASSLGMALPISTPPNALAYATGLVDSKGMAISGTILCLIGLALTFAMMYGLGALGFFG